MSRRLLVCNGTDMTDDIVAQGLELMLYGMGTVVIFLALLVLITTVMSRVVTRYFPEPLAPASSPAPKSPARTPAGAIEGEVVAAITAAVRQHRSKKQ
jgi:oxaloacetate decarboxylase (Na+ extruding) subunit gamma